MENLNSKNLDNKLNLKDEHKTINKISKKYFCRKTLKNFKNIKNRKKFKILIISLFLVIILIIVISILNILFLNKTKKKEMITKDISVQNKKINKNKKNLILRKNLNEEIREIQRFSDMAIKGILYNPNETFYKSEDPKISIVITVHNGEGYIKNAVFSIQNQDFKDIEIVFIDDSSTDNSTKTIKELMEKDPRIQFYQNEENKGALYTKTKGVLLSKGKYILLLDQDDFYLQKDAFSTLYEIMKEDNLDILGFSSVFCHDTIFRSSNRIHIYTEMPVIYQPNVSQMFFYYDIKGKPKRKTGVLWNYIIRSELFKKIIKQIDDKFMNVKMNWHDDQLIFFLLTRNAYNMRIIKRIFYAKMVWHRSQDPKIIYSKNEKKKNEEDMHCSGYLNYLEFLLMKLNNTINDKRFASFELDNWYLKSNCRNNNYTKEKGKYVCKLFLDNEYIEEDVKKKIKSILYK